MPLPWAQAPGPARGRDRPQEQAPARDKDSATTPVQAAAWPRDRTRVKDLVQGPGKLRVQALGKGRALNLA